MPITPVNSMPPSQGTHVPPYIVMVLVMVLVLVMVIVLVLVLVLVMVMVMVQGSQWLLQRCNIITYTLQ